MKDECVLFSGLQFVEFRMAKVQGNSYDGESSFILNVLVFGRISTDIYRVLLSIVYMERKMVETVTGNIIKYYV